MVTFSKYSDSKYLIFGLIFKLEKYYIVNFTLQPDRLEGGRIKNDASLFVGRILLTVRIKC